MSLRRVHLKRRAKIYDPLLILGNKEETGKKLNIDLLKAQRLDVLPRILLEVNV